MLEAIRQVQRALAGRVPLIGFAGAPFTLASYAIEGGHSSTFAHTKLLMYGAPAAWHGFCDTLAEVIGDYLVAQIDAGVDAVMIFDSWVGALNASDYREFIPAHEKIFVAYGLQRGPNGVGVPTIHFGVGPGRSGQMRDAGATSSARTGARRSTKRGIASAPIAPSRASRSHVLLGPLDAFRRDRRCTARAGGRPGHFQSRSRYSSVNTGRHVQALARYVIKKRDVSAGARCRCKVHGATCP